MELTRKFMVIDEDFICAVCGEEVPRLGYTARNHCRKCLCSVHLDVNPGDRQSDCGGVLRPFSLESHKKGNRIVHKCDKCGAIRRNVCAEDDDYGAILKLSAKNIYEK